jgi:hypothetical protein
LRRSSDLVGWSIDAGREPVPPIDRLIGGIAFFCLAVFEVAIPIAICYYVVKRAFQRGRKNVEKNPLDFNESWWDAF